MSLRVSQFFNFLRILLLDVADYFAQQNYNDNQKNLPFRVVNRDSFKPSEIVVEKMARKKSKFISAYFLVSRYIT